MIASVWLVTETKVMGDCRSLTLKSEEGPGFKVDGWLQLDGERSSLGRVDWEAQGTVSPVASQWVLKTSGTTLSSGGLLPLEDFFLWATRKNSKRMK